MELLDLFRNPEFYVSYDAGQVVFEEREAGDVMYVVVEGEVEIRIRGALLDVRRKGEVFGELAVIDSRPRSATAVARYATKLAPINQKRFALLVQQNPQFALHIMKVLAKYIRRLDELIETNQA